MLSLAPQIIKPTTKTTTAIPTDKTCFYQQLQHLPSNDIYNVFINNPDLKQARVLFKEASAFWNKETLQKLMLNETDPKYHWWKLDLFKTLVADYRTTHNLDILLESIPLDGAPTTLTPLYNTIIRASVKQKRLDHTERVLNVMKERQVTPDIASYNIIMSLKLNQSGNHGNHGDADRLYNEIILGNNIKPNPATFNMLMKHACEKEDWDSVQKWLDELIKCGLEPTEVTARILFKVFVQHSDNKTLMDAFDRVMDKVQLRETEQFVNIGVSALLESGRLDTAFKLLEKNTYNNNNTSTTTTTTKSSNNRSYNLLIQGLLHQHKLDKAENVLNRMINDDNIPNPDVVTFTMLIHNIIRKDNVNLEKIKALYQQMINLGIRSNSVLQSVLLYGFTKYKHSSDLKTATSLFHLMLQDKNKVQLPRLDTDRPLECINIYNIMMDFYFLYYHENKKLKEVIPTQPFTLLNQAIDQNIKPTLTTLNILIRGTALFNHDLNTAEGIVHLFENKHNIKMDERTLWYLTKCAYYQGRFERGREWINSYEKDGHVIKGTGLLALRSTLMKYQKENV
jgi:pentatricopeptide repeat protein